MPHLRLMNTTTHTSRHLLYTNGSKIDQVSMDNNKSYMRNNDVIIRYQSSGDGDLSPFAMTERLLFAADSSTFSFML